ncbi:unnamed protein product [Urochloa humidicola]
MAAIQAGRLKDALLVVAAHEDAADIFSANVKLVDAASGATVAQLDTQHADHISAAAGLICLVPAGTSGSAIRVLNPATGGVTDIPAAGQTATAAPAHHGGRRRTTTVASPTSSYVFAQVPSTKEYKLLRVSSLLESATTSPSSHVRSSPSVAVVGSVGGRRRALHCCSTRRCPGKGRSPEGSPTS